MTISTATNSKEFIFRKGPIQTRLAYEVDAKGLHAVSYGRYRVASPSIDEARRTWKMWHKRAISDGFTLIEKVG